MLPPVVNKWYSLRVRGGGKKKEGNRPCEGLPIRKSAALNIGASADKKFNLDLIKLKPCSAVFNLRLHV